MRHPLPSQCTHKLVGHKGAVNCVKFSANGNYVLTGGADRSVRLWNPSQNILVKTFEDHYWLLTSQTHGCEFGLRAVCGDEAGKLMKKPWTISTNSEVIGNALASK